MPYCSSCCLPVQGHQLPMGPRCTILLDKSSHTSDLEPKYTMCAQPWCSHPKRNRSTRSASFASSKHWETLSQMKWTHWRTKTPRLGLCTSHRKTTPSRPSLISSLSWSISCFCSNPFDVQVTQQGAYARNPHPELIPAEEQFSSALAPSLSLLPPSWPQAREASPGNHQATHQKCSPAHGSRPQHW